MGEFQAPIVMIPTIVTKANGRSVRHQILNGLFLIIIFHFLFILSQGLFHVHLCPLSCGVVRLMKAWNC
jgi:hypothetical protein